MIILHQITVSLSHVSASLIQILAQFCLSFVWFGCMDAWSLSDMSPLQQASDEFKLFCFPFMFAP